jgi:hypothetical protein
VMEDQPKRQMDQFLELELEFTQKDIDNLQFLLILYYERPSSIP